MKIFKKAWDNIFESTKHLELSYEEMMERSKHLMVPNNNNIPLFYTNKKGRSLFLV